MTSSSFWGASLGPQTLWWVQAISRELTHYKDCVKLQDWEIKKLTHEKTVLKRQNDQQITCQQQIIHAQTRLIESLRHRVVQHRGVSLTELNLDSLFLPQSAETCHEDFIPDSPSSGMFSTNILTAMAESTDGEAPSVGGSYTPRDQRCQSSQFADGISQ